MFEKWQVLFSSPNTVCHDDQVRLPQMSDIEGLWIIELIEICRSRPGKP